MTLHSTSRSPVPRPQHAPHTLKNGRPLPLHPTPSACRDISQLIHERNQVAQRTESEVKSVEGGIHGAYSSHGAVRRYRLQTYPQTLNFSLPGIYYLRGQWQ
ncbi:hypothetical protein JB92DRAFT_521259 [Gautieria morchelliformis]|nr:hypothetical protein JB92DRAFT_521259 [Gautieria morchelliformis]